VPVVTPCSARADCPAGDTFVGGRSWTPSQATSFVCDVESREFVLVSDQPPDLGDPCFLDCQHNRGVSRLSDVFGDRVREREVENVV
jgi:hypothetical protein